MKRTLRTWLCGAAVLLCGTNSLRAQQFLPADAFAPPPAPTFAPPEAALAGYAATFDDGGDGSCTTADAPRRCATTPPRTGRDFLTCTDRCGGFTGGAEVVFLRPYSSGFGLTPLDFFGLGIGIDAAQSAQLGFEPSARYWIGYQSADGLGGRIRYWAFDRGAEDLTGVNDLVLNGADGLAMTNLGLEFRTLDLELTQAVDFRRWNLTLSGGLRYAETGVNRTDVEVDTGVAESALISDTGFDGFGLTLGLQAARDLNASGSWRMAMGARWSGLYGNRKASFTEFDIVGGVVDDFISFRVNDATTSVIELNLGPQYRRRLQNGSFLTFSAGLESQTWQGSDNGISLFGLGLLGGADIGFAGFASSISITR